MVSMIKVRGVIPDLHLYCDASSTFGCAIWSDRAGEIGVANRIHMKVNYYQRKYTHCDSMPAVVEQ